MSLSLPHYPVPDDDTARVAAVRRLRILDSAPESDFDDIAWLAAQITQSPIALVSLLDSDRQWFKAHYGIDSYGSSRSISFCAYAIMGSEPFEVPDTLADARFANNPMVTGTPYVRSYVGVPLIGDEGFAYGTLCVLSDQSRTLEEHHIQALRCLARQAVAQLEMRRDRRESESQKQILSLLLEAMPDGVVSCGNDGLLREFNQTARQWHGTDPRALLPIEWAHHFNLYEADGLKILATEHIPLFRALRGEHVRNVEIVIRAKGQPPRIVLCNADPVPGEGAVCVMHDITQIKQAGHALTAERARLQALVDASYDVAIIAFDQEGRIDLFNPGAEALLGYTASEVIGDCPARFHVAEELAERMRHIRAPDQRYGYGHLAAAAARGELEQAHWTLQRKDGTLRQVRMSFNAIQEAGQGTTGYLVMAIDLTAQQRAQEAAQLAAERFSGAFNTAAQGMAIVSLEGAWMEVNTALCQMLGYTREELLSTTFQALTHPDDINLDLQQLQELIAGQSSSYSLSKRYYGKHGQLIWALLSVSLVRGNDGKPLHLISQIQDVTERQVALERLRESEARLRAINDATSTLVSQFDGALRCRFANDAHGHWLGCDPAVLIGQHVLQLLGGKVTEIVTDALAQVLAGQRASFEYVMQGQAIGRRDVEVALVPDTTCESGGVPGFFMMIQDVTVHKTLARLMQERATRDALTGLPNRHAWTEALQSAADEARITLKAVAVMFLDLNGFKHINDTYGHRAGDALLIEFGKRLQQAVGEEHMVARLAGDEFVVMLRGLADPENAPAQIAARVLNAIADGMVFGEHVLPMLPSIGIAWHIGERVEPASLMHAADEAMYAAKREGRAIALAPVEN